MAFDPDAYLADKTETVDVGGFDPNTYLSEVVSSDIPQEDLDRNILDQRIREFDLASGKRELQTNAILKLDKPDRIRQISTLPTLHLLESVSQLNPVTQHSARTQMIKQLQQQGVPLDAINDYVQVAKPQGNFGMELLKKEGIPTATSIAGGIIGARAGKPFRGTAIGRAVGETIQRGAERLFMTERQKSIGKDITEGSINVAIDIAGDWAGQRIIKTGAKFLKPAGRTRKFGVGPLDEVLESAGKRVTQADVPPDIGEIVQLKAGGVGLESPAGIRPGAATNNSYFASLDNMSDKAAATMQRTKRDTFENLVAFKKRTDDILASYGDDLVDTLTPSQTGAALDDMIRGNGAINEGLRDVYRQFYSQLDDLIETRIVDVIELRPNTLGLVDDTGRALMVPVKVGERIEGGVSNVKVKATAQKLVDLVEKGRLIKGTDESASFIKNIANAADDSTFSEAITNRSQVFELARKFDDAGEAGAARLARQFGIDMDIAMETAAKQHGPEALKTWRRGNKVFKAVKKRIEPEVLTKLAKAAADNPEMATKTIFIDKHVTGIRKVKKLLTSPIGKSKAQAADGKKIWAQLKESYVTGIFNDATSSKGTAKGLVFGDMINSRLNAMGPEALKAIFDPGELKGLRELARLGELVQGKVAGEGGMFIQLMQPAAAATIVAGGKGRAAAIALLAITPVWTKMAMNPTTRKLLINGLIDIDKRGIKAVGGAAAKATAAYFRTRREYLDEQALKAKEEKRKKINRAVFEANRIPRPI